jgi:hypothetical protein
MKTAEIRAQAGDPLASLSHGLNEKDIVVLLINHLQQDHKLTQTQINEMLLKKQEPTLPITVFSDKLSALETIVKYCIENLGMGYTELANTLNRDVRTIWTTYKNSQKKLRARFYDDVFPKYSIPLSTFRDRHLSTLEIMVHYLNESCGLTLTEVARLLQRDVSTIYTVSKRAKVKRKHG